MSDELVRRLPKDARDAARIMAELETFPTGQAILDDCAARIEAAEAKVARLVEAVLPVLEAADRARMVVKPGAGVSGMTVEANLRGSVYNGLDVWPVEGLRAALASVQAQEGETNG